MAVQFIATTRKTFLNGKPLFKVVTLPYAESLFVRNNPHLWFASPEKWEDPFEKRFILTKYKLPTGALVDYPLKGKVFCTCFSKDRIVESQWNKYSKYGGYSFGITINREELLRQLELYSVQNSCDIYLGPVQYQQTKVIEGAISKNPFLKDFHLSDNASAVRLLFLKRNAFVEEGEFRIVIVQNTASPDGGIPLYFKCQPNDLIQKVIKHPCLPEPTLFFDFLEKHRGFGSFTNASGQLFHRIVKSRLYDKRIPQFIKL